MLSFSECEQLLHDLTGDSDNADMMDVDSWDDIEDDCLPPGDEAFLQSHAGGEAILHEILDGMTPRSDFPTQIIVVILNCKIPRHRRTGDLQTCKDHTQQHINAWRSQPSFLTDAYPSWKHKDPLGAGNHDELDASALDTWSILTVSFTGQYFALGYYLHTLTQCRAQASPIHTFCDC